ncbi:MAG: hypothetical protein HOP28_07180 [Gemmatimonadales bacterium]|nr:hypothetical protein [Gemmatimonadales bacterium]
MTTLTITASLLSGCGEGPKAEPLVIGEVAEWPVASVPRISVGADTLDLAHELAGVSSARRLAGRLVVANSGAFELRIYDSTGKYLTTVGQKGEGPGEFRGTLFLFPAQGDSLYVLDSGNLRYSVHDASGKYVRMLDRGTDALVRPTWLYRRTIVESNVPGQAPRWAVAVLERLPDAQPGAPVRRARFDNSGLLWVTDSVSSNRWTVWADSARAVARVTLPPGLALLEAGTDFVLGVEHDAVGREIVRAYDLTRSAPLVFPPPAAEPFPLPGNPAAEARVKSHLRNLVVAQEVHYGEHGHYTAAADSLVIKADSDIEVLILEADGRHWAVVLYERTSKTTCGISIGFPPPPGWLDGVIVCGR